MNKLFVAGSLLLAATVYTVSLCGPTTTAVKPEESMSKEKIKTIMGREIIDKCACGKHVEVFDRQDLGVDPKTGNWQRICEECIVNRPKEKLTNGLSLA